MVPSYCDAAPEGGLSAVVLGSSAVGGCPLRWEVGGGGGGGKKLVFFGVYLWQSKAAARFTTILAHPRNPQARGTLGWLVYCQSRRFLSNNYYQCKIFFLFKNRSLLST